MASYDYEKVCSYYGVLLGFLYSIGNVASYQGMKRNTEDGVPSVCEVVKKGKIDVDARIDGWESHLEEAKKLLNKHSRALGYLPVRNEDMERIVKFCKTEARREYLRNKAAKYLRYGVPHSIAELIQERLNAEKKAAKRKAKKTEGGEENG